MRDLLLATIVFALLPLCFVRPWIGILLWTWIGMMGPQWLTFGFAQDVQWAMIVGATTIAGIAFSRDRKPIPWNMQLALMVVLGAYFAFTTVFAWVPDAALEQLKLVMKVIFMAILGTTVIYGRQRIRWLLIVIVLSIAYYGIKGAIWVIATGGGNMVVGPDGGFFQGNNAIGIGLLMAIPVMLALAREDRRKWVRGFLNGAVLLSCISVVFTYSRGAMLGLAASAPLMFLSTRRKLIAVIVLAPIVTAAVMFAPEKIFDRAETIATYEQDRSAMQRLLAWSVAWNIALEHPLVGAGYNFDSSTDQERWLSYGDPEFRDYLAYSRAAHSMYFQILGEHGFIALALYLTLLFSTLRRCTQLRKCTTGDPDLEWVGNYAVAIRIALVGYMVAGAFYSAANFELAWVYYSFTAILGREIAQLRPGVRNALGHVPRPVPAWRKPRIAEAHRQAPSTPALAK